MKKSQTHAGGIAALIVLIALFMVLYLILLPPKERSELLGENENTTTENGQAELKKDVLLSQQIGLLKPFEKDTNEHELDSVSLFLKEEPVITDLATSLTTTRSLFSKDVKELRFNVKDLDNLEQVDLFFLVNEAKGDLIIKLNNIEIFNNKAQGLQTVLLPKDLLKDTNKLTFELSSPGINFFSRNKYLLTNIKLRQNFELTNTQETRIFTLTETETGDAKLNFFIFCNDAKSNARLRIFLNNNEISNQVVGCISSERTIEISKDDLKEGRNNLVFEIDKGDYLLNDITVKVELEEGGAKSYKFSLTEDQLNEILDNDREVNLDLSFNDEKKKRATISINGNEFTLETEDLEYSRLITSLVKEGNNLIRINPDNEFIVDLLEIRIE